MPPKPVRNYSVGDLVFAKIKGYPPWPARIEKDFPAGYKPYPGRYPVFFFGTYESAVVSAKDIYPYQQYKHQHGIKRKMKNFNEGLEEIEKHPNITMDSEEISRLIAERENSQQINNDDDGDESDVSFQKSDESESSDDVSESDLFMEKSRPKNTKNVKKNKKPRKISRKDASSGNESSDESERKSIRNKKSNFKKNNKNTHRSNFSLNRTENNRNRKRKNIQSSDSEVEISEENNSGDDPSNSSQNEESVDSKKMKSSSQSPEQGDSKMDSQEVSEKNSSDEEEANQLTRKTKTYKRIAIDSDSDSKSKENSNNTDNIKKLKPTETIEDVLKLKQKLQDEKLAQKLEEKEREKERRKREKMERKRLERLKQAQKSHNQTIKEMLNSIDQNIKNSLSKNNANIDKCLETMDSIADVKVKITSKNLPNLGDNLKELIQTLRKCRKYKPDDRVRQKADLYLNKLKEFLKTNDLQPNELKTDAEDQQRHQNNQVNDMKENGTTTSKIIPENDETEPSPPKSPDHIHSPKDDENDDKKEFIHCMDST